MLAFLALFSICILPSYSYLPFSFYKDVCNLNPDCFTVFKDGSNPNSELGYKSIERWSYITPSSDPQTNIGFAQSHSQALSYKLWHQQDFNYKGTWPVFSESSIVLAANQVGYSVCASPNSGLSHLPLSPIVNEDFEFEDSKVYLKPAFDEFDSNGKWCDLEGLKGVDVDQAIGFGFKGYDYEILVSNMKYDRIRDLLKSKGIGIVTINHDSNMSQGTDIYFDGEYAAGEAVYDYPANVVGAKLDGDGSVWILVYAFGAHNHENNYLWVRPREIVGDSISFIRDFDLN